ncbi:Uncharacterised protein [Buttiauxella agrestis]|uniref:PLD phosphodiesterase domain-containing protein n=1 Tax=Buttiauxella agrestis TaxID=82977 RepID=A0A381CDS3_9ENTR|nr:hypothetical protein [Buttiauxella agrestis]SUW65203.1 Uncharacterised protein [Buttiauxella agrestis]
MPLNLFTIGGTVGHIFGDRYVLVGSANINDRSLLGDRDSELAVLISDTAHGYTDLDGTGKTSPYRNFARELRQSAWRKWLGSTAGEFAEALDKPATGWGKIQEVARENAKNYEKVFSFIPRDNYNNIGADSDNVTNSKDSENAARKTSVTASIWPVIAANMSATFSDTSNMTFSETFWQYYQYRDNGILQAIKGYFTALPVHWTEGENNLIPYNMRLIASNAEPDGKDVQVADNSDGNDEQGGLS